MSELALRRMRWWDVERVQPLERELFPADPWSAETFWSELAGVPGTRYYVVAEDDTGVVGYAGLLVAGGTADVQTVAVARSAQGRGVGALLLESLVDEAVRRGCEAVMLEVRADNGPAIALYQRFGFDQISVRREYYQPGGVDALVLRRLIGRAGT
jgi:ribosomal-protein-alanine N-acetyltransferase